MKKFLTLVISLLLVMSLFACGDNSKNEPDGSVPSPTASTSAFGITESRPIPQNFLYAEAFASSTTVIGNDNIGRDKVTSITFLDTLRDAPADAWDASNDKNGSVMAWIDNEGNLSIAGEGGVSAISCKRLFKDYYNARSINFNNCFYTDLVTDMSSMFASSDALESLDLSFFNTSKVTNMSNMFAYCLHLKSVDLSSFDTSKVTNMSAMFQLTSLRSLDLSNFNTSKVTNMQYMFEACDNLTSIDLSSFDTSKVTNMGNMFCDCESLISIDLSNFNTSAVTNMRSMFSSCGKLEKLNLSSFDFSSLKDATDMFRYSDNLSDIGCTITLPKDCLSDNMYEHTSLK